MYPLIPTITVASKTLLPVESMGKVNLLLNGNKESKIETHGTPEFFKS